MIGPLLAHTITLPLGYFLAEPGARGVFLPQTMPDGFVRDSATPLLLRPREFLANARDLVTLKEAVREQAPRYATIRAPVVVIAGDGADKTVSTSIHSRPFAATVPNAKLIVLPDVGHMVPQAAPDLVVSEIEAMIGRIAPARRPPLPIGNPPRIRAAERSSAVAIKKQRGGLPSRCWSFDTGRCRARDKSQL